MTRKILAILFAVCAIAPAASAQVLGNYTGTVNAISLGSMPSAVIFSMTPAPAGCPVVGGFPWLKLAPSSTLTTDSLKAVFSGVLAAQLSGRQLLVNVNGLSPEGYCSLAWVISQ
ncbi:MAG TPA: hypothetical protein VGH20_14650 [Myxococcales bacterium]|jgi:hypothetical protein